MRRRMIFRKIDNEENNIDGRIKIIMRILRINMGKK